MNSRQINSFYSLIAAKRKTKAAKTTKAPRGGRKKPVGHWRRSDDFVLPPPPAEHTEADADAVEEIDENAYSKDAGFLSDTDLVVQSVYNALPEVLFVHH